ncbi:MAG: methylmalonyl-CoA carboxyltransferase [Clostridiales bacterium]|nr:methylmalonyl-CoA carboxyltransferase [Clostridiales bacterium]
MIKIEDLREKRKEILKCGGDEKTKKQHKNGKMTARERLNLLLDEKSFVEIDMFVTHRSNEFGMHNISAPGEGVVTGYGTINGRTVYVYSQDFTVMGGSLGEEHAAKICKIMDIAIKTGNPIIGINDSGGARIQEGNDALKGFGEIFRRNSHASGVIPQISINLGPCAGGAVYSPALCDFIFMVNKISQLFITGPSVIKAITGEDVTFESLGGADVHSQISGVAAFKSPNEAECFLLVKKLFTFLPSNNLETPPTCAREDNPNRLNEKIFDFLPSDSNKSYDIINIIKEVVDFGDFLEIFENYAKNIVIGFARLNGNVVGIIANQPKVLAGVLDFNSSTKAARFIRFCDCFNIPLVTFTDVPGYLPGISQEHSGIIRHGAKLLYAFSEATVPKINVILRKAYGGAYIAMNSKHLGADMVFAWPSAEIAVMGPEGAANIIFRKEIASSNDPISARKEKILEYKENFSNPFVAASRGYVDDVIEPHLTRIKIISALEILKGKRESRPKKKHGNIPL